MKGPAIIRSRIGEGDFRSYYEDTMLQMVKIVVDIDRSVLTLGGELHADGEQVLLDDGSRQEHLWGANIHPGQLRDRQIVFEAMVNLRPRQGNRSMAIQDEATRSRVESVIRELLPLP